MVNALLDEMDFVENRIAEVERKLEAIALTQPNVALLRTIPGVGPRTAEAIVAFTDVVSRFADRKRFVSYFGMTPTEDSSGLVQRRGRISKRGPSVVRWLVVESAHRVIARCPALRAFFDRVRRGRKVLAIAYGMMRYQTPFDPVRVLGRAA